MSLPNYLAKIKSSGIYRFVWDKSEIAGVDAEILRLVVGYSEKGPFNTPVYIKSEAEFKAVFGDISKKLEKRGVYFHRMALQALNAGPILALNLKKFKDETVKTANFDVVADGDSTICIDPKDVDIENIYNTSRFWALDPDKLQKYFDDHKAKPLDAPKYISLAATDSKDASCTIVMRGFTPSGYDVTLKSWYSTVAGEDVPSWAEGYENLLVSDFFAEIYVFSGEFTTSLATSEALKRYFVVENGVVRLADYVVNAFGEKVDTLNALSRDENSGFIRSYSGTLLPYFKNASGSYISLDLIFNADNPLHKMMMDFNTEALDNEDGYITKLITTGWTAEAGHPLLSCVDLHPTKTAASYDGKEWSYTPVKGSEPECYPADLYEFPLDGDDIKSLPANKWGAVNFAEGDRFLLDGEIITLSRIDKFELSESTSSDDIISFTFYKLDGNEVASEDLKDKLIKCNHSAGETCHKLTPAYFEGYTFESAKPRSMKMADKLDWQNEILSALTDYPGIRIGLTNRVDLDYRYIVDTFEAFVDSELHAPLAIIAKEKDNALALLNFPSAKTFQTCDYTSFTDDKNNFQVKYIADGCNRQKPAGRLFTLVSEANGASFASYNSPLVFSDGTVKTTVPAAAMVSNNFMEKYLSRQPYYIVAGPTYGRMIASGLVGPDFNYSRADLDILEPMGVNAMVYVPRKGTYINSNQTAKQNPVTALSKINVRELVIYLQDEIEKLLQDYQWEFNTPNLRDTIKAKADYICENVRNNGGIYDYLNVCDESNNTNDVIDNEMFVLSTSIEPGRGCGRMVQELTIYRTGQISALIR